MVSWLPDLPVFSAFLAASLILAVTPGPGVFYIVTRSLADGRRAGLSSVAGVALGNFGNAIGAAAGLAAIFNASATAFEIVRYLGAAYLVWLGIRAIAGAAPAPAPRRRANASHIRVVRDGFVVALLNPKTALFFAAFLPQFVTGAMPHPLQPVVLAAVFVLIAAFTDMLYALFASSLAPALSRAHAPRRFGRYLAAGAYIGLGVFTAVAGTRRDR